MRAVFPALLLGLTTADVYMHSMRGSNNRLNEKSANRNNGNRLFDSQNNNRGGYNVGDETTQAFADTNGGDGNKNKDDSIFNQELNVGQYSMMYMEDSLVDISWTAQHGCGGSEENDPHKTNCNMVIQMACNTDGDEMNDALKAPLHVELKDGRNTNTPDTTNDFGNLVAQRDANDANGRGRHESEQWYYECERRYRNKGLFVADQKLKGNAMKYTRQNPNGNRRGLECPEERDYFPYWRPSPWMDVAVMTDKVADCTEGPNYTGLSQNVVPKCNCVAKEGTDGGREESYKHLTQAECEAATDTIWSCLSWNIAAPKCAQASWGRVNHLGNVKGSIEPANFKWNVPTLASLPAQVQTNGATIAKCVMRLRYNISTDDYNPQETDARSNDDNDRNVQSPVQQNPTVDVGAALQGLKLAINTAQFGRTFQDRSHSFYIRKKPAELASCRGKIQNLVVRGKRGNIVQTFPSVEYDFVPTNVEIPTTPAADQPGDCLHVQWTGSNTHNNGNPAGDGQAGDAGEGTGGTDRHNLVGTPAEDENYPIAFDQDLHDGVNLIKTGLSKCMRFDNTKSNYLTTIDGELGAEDCAIHLASAGYYKDSAEVETKDALNVLLNNANPSFSAVLQVKADATTTNKKYSYMCTRNNNFSNRSQKGTVKIVP